MSQSLNTFSVCRSGTFPKAHHFFKPILGLHVLRGLQGSPAPKSLFGVFFPSMNPLCFCHLFSVVVKRVWFRTKQCCFEVVDILSECCPVGIWAEIWWFSYIVAWPSEEICRETGVMLEVYGLTKVDTPVS